MQSWSWSQRHRDRDVESSRNALVWHASEIWSLDNELFYKDEAVQATPNASYHVSFLDPITNKQSSFRSKNIFTRRFRNPKVLPQSGNVFTCVPIDFDKKHVLLAHFPLYDQVQWVLTSSNKFIHHRATNRLYSRLDIFEGRMYGLHIDLNGWICERCFG